jgi:2'-5' RNA ligase
MPAMPRLFTGVEIPTDVSFDLEIMKGGIIGARWIDRESFHITLRFIGDIDASLAREIAYELDGVEARPFSLRLKGIDVMGGNKPQRCRIESAELRRLQSIHDDCPGACFRRSGGNLCRNGAGRLRSRFGGCTVLASHNLYRSRCSRLTVSCYSRRRPTRGGGPYAVEESYDLQAA